MALGFLALGFFADEFFADEFFPAGLSAVAVLTARTTSGGAGGVVGRAFLPYFFSALTWAFFATLLTLAAFLPSATAAAAAAMACSPRPLASSTSTLKPLAGSNLGTVTPATLALPSPLAAR